MCVFAKLGEPERAGLRLRGAVATALVCPAPTPPGPPFARGGARARGGSLAQYGSDGAGWSGPPLQGGEAERAGLRLRSAVATALVGPAPTPRPPLCKGGARARGGSLAQCGSDGAGWSGPHPPRPPLCKGGEAERAGVRLRSAVATALVGPAPTPPGPPFARGGGGARGGSLAQCGSDGAGWSGPPFARGGARARGASFAQCGSDGAGLSGPHPPRPPLCKGGSQSARGFACAVR